MNPPPCPTDNKGVSALPTTPPPLPTPTPVAAPALSLEHLQQLAAAQARGRRIGRAVAVARFDGWSVATFAFFTLLFGLTSVPGVLLGGLMGVVAFVELRAAAALKRLDPAAAKTLGTNQVALALLLAGYALWRIYGELTGPGQYAEIAATDAQLADMLAPVEDLTRMLSVAVYGGIIAFALFAQGGMALYYFTRGKHVRAYLAETPAWVVTVQRAGSIH